MSEVPEGKYLCILIPAKGTKRKLEGEDKDELEEGKGEAEEAANAPKGEEE